MPQRLNYIGSKYQLLDWIFEAICAEAGWDSLAGKTVADLFAGTGIVSYELRQRGARVVANDAELYSSIITHALARSNYTAACRAFIRGAGGDAADAAAAAAGFITAHYSPAGEAQRQYFTVENARRIDACRAQIEAARSGLSDDEYKFLLASLLVSADAVSNVPAVYGCFLKSFKAKALRPFVLMPISEGGPRGPPEAGSKVPSEGGAEGPPEAAEAAEAVVYHSDVLAPGFAGSIVADAVYLDPPYNARQYSKNYFPLNIIAKTPAELAAAPPILKGKTGIPADCFVSPFCSKRNVAAAFRTLFRDLRVPLIFVSYNSESLLSKAQMLEIMSDYGTASVIECDYKRFKSFEYNEDKQIKEYLFCLKKNAD